MTPSDAIDVGRDAISVLLLLAGPIMGIGLGVGLVVALFQALTQIQDQTISFVPKIVAMIATVAFCLPWLVQRMMEYSEDIILDIPRIVMGG